MSLLIGNALHALFVPLAGLSLVLPNTALAEVIRYQTPEPLPQAPAGVLGTIQWRGVRLPVVALEVALGRPASTPARRAHLAVMNTWAGEPQVPFFALLIEDLPQLIRASADTLTPASGEAGAYIAQHVLVHGEPAVIPRPEALEDLARRALLA